MEDECIADPEVDDLTPMFPANQPTEYAPRTTVSIDHTSAKKDIKEPVSSQLALSTTHRKMAPISWEPKFEIQPPGTKYCVLSYPAPDVLLVRLNRPKQLNCINTEGNEELDRVWTWLDKEPSLRVGIITGTGRAFCAGADLKGMLCATLS